MPRKKKESPAEPAPLSAPASRGPAVVYRGPAPAFVRGHIFQPGVPVYGLPAEFVGFARRKPVFEVTE